MKQIKGRTGGVIKSLESWREQAEIKTKHWKDTRSAKELARVFFRSGFLEVPAELSAFFEQAPEWKNTELDTGYAEHQTKFDEFGRGNKGRRQHDLLLRGSQKHNSRVIGIEAKADESFDVYLREKYLRISNPRSKLRLRIEGLELALFGRVLTMEERDFGYQLLPAVAGTLVEAAKAGAGDAMLIIWEFKSPGLDERHLLRNREHLENFLKLFGVARPFVEGKPFRVGRVPGTGAIPGNVNLWIGKIVSSVSAYVAA